MRVDTFSTAAAVVIRMNRSVGVSVRARIRSGFSRTFTANNAINKVVVTVLFMVYLPIVFESFVKGK